MNGNKIRSAVLFAITIATVFAFSTQAQESMAGMDHSTRNVIDGSTHPELITDDDAYFMFFLSMEDHNGSEQERSRQVGAFRRLGLTGDQENDVVAVLNGFTQENQQLIAASNTAIQNVEKSWGPSSERDIINIKKQIRNNQKNLTAITRAKLELIFGFQKASAFNAFIQGEKRGMKIAVAE